MQCSIDGLVWPAAEAMRVLRLVVWLVFLAEKSQSQVDNHRPVIAGCPADLFLTTSESSPSAVGTWTPPTATDDGPFTRRSTHNPGQRFPVGRTKVVYTFTDTMGLSSMCSFYIQVTVVAGCVVPDFQPEVLTAAPDRDIYLPGDEVTFSCAEGYHLTSGSAMRVCRVDTTWSGQQPVCTAKAIVSGCEFDNMPSAVLSRVPDQPFYPVGTKVNFDCADGYQLIGSEIRICRRDFTWSGQEAQCKAEDSSGVPVAAVVGGATGAVIIIIVVLAVAIVIKRNRKEEPNQNDGAMPDRVYHTEIFTSWVYPTGGDQ